MICANLIGMRGICDATETKIYLDDFGITLNHASKLAQGFNHTGADLFNSKLALAWDLTMNDILIDGFEFNKILSTYDNKFTDQTTTATTIKLTNYCEHAGIYINFIRVKVIGTGTLNVLLNGVEILITNPSTPGVNNVSNETIKIELNKYVDNGTVLTINSTGVQIQDASGFSGLESWPTTQNGDGIPAEISGYVKCDKSYFLCRYADVIAHAVVYKLGALMLNEQLLNPNYNDFIAYSNEDKQLTMKIAQLDTSLSVVPLDQLPNKKGLYQKEIEKISKIIKPPKCDCCFECEGTVSFGLANL